MYVIIGLGNPGERYLQTRHNIGFMVVDAMCDRWGGRFQKGKGSYFQTKITVNDSSVLLAKPTTYMNLSGLAVRHIVDFYKLSDYSKMLIVLDDFHLPFGAIRLKPEGSAGGQKGLKSIIETLHTRQIPRLRIGIGNNRLRAGEDASNFVLSTFSQQERKQLPDVIDWAVAAVTSFVSDDITIAMNQFNRNILDDELT